MSRERVLTIDPPQRLPEDKIKNPNALNLDLENLSGADQFLILTSVLSGKERNKGVHSRTYNVKINEKSLAGLPIAVLPTELYELADVQKVRPLNSNLIIKSRVRLLNSRLDSENDILVGWDYIRKALVYKLENKRFLGMRRRKFSMNYQYFGQDFLLQSDPSYDETDYKHYSDEKKELYKRLYSRGSEDRLEFAFSDLCEFLNSASLKDSFVC